MTNIELFDKIKAEIERIKAEHPVGSFGESFEGGFDAGYCSCCCEIEDIISNIEKSMTENVADGKDLDDLITKELADVYGTYTTPDYLEKDTTEASCHFDFYIARHFVHWERKRMMEEAVEISYKGGMARINGEEKPFEGGKVRIIIVNED